MDINEFKKTYEHKKVVENDNQVTQQPVVSVCVQTYQHVNYIKQCLDSILTQQTNFEFEILLGDDASIDGTRKICKAYAERYPDKIRLFLHHRENNIKIGGQPTGRFNFLYNLYSAQGKYIALCEGDDYWTDPLKLQKQVNFLEANEDFVVACHNAKIVDQDGVLIQEKKLPDLHDDEIYSKTALKKGAFLLTLSLVFRNLNFFKSYPEGMFKVLNGDTYLISLLGKHGKGYYMDNIQPAVYRVHSGGIWSMKKNNSVFVWRNRLQLLYALRELHKNETNLRDYFNIKITNTYRILIRNLEKLEFHEVLSVNKNYLKRHNFFKDTYRAKEFLRENFKYLISKSTVILKS